MPPWSKEPGPLGKAQKEGDVLKKRVDQTVKEATKLANNKKLADREAKLEQMYLNCIEIKTLVQKHHDSIEKLKEDDEQNKIKDFDKKKTTELNRVSVMKMQLTESMNKLLPDTTEAEFIKRHHPQESDDKGNTESEAKKAQSSKEADDDEDEEDEDDEDEEETEDEDDEVEEEKSAKEKKPVSQIQKKRNEDEEEDDDDDDEDDEEEEEDATEEKQKKDTTAKHEKKKVEDDDEEEEDDDEEDDDEDEDEEEDDDEDEEDEDSESISKKKMETKKKGKKKDADEMEVTQTAHRFVAIQEYEGEEEGDLAFEKGDVLTIIDTREDGWWMAQNEKGEKGLVPKTFLQIHNPYKDVQLDDEDEEEEESDEDTESPRRSGRALWGGIKKAVNETTVSDVLHAMGAVPSGFRTSTLCRKFNEGNTFRMANYLAPKLSQSNLTYRDLIFDPATNRIRPRPARIERLITLVSCQQIPPPGAGIEVLDRHVRICLFDGQHILSNIHSVKVASVDKSTRSWTFTTRVHDLMDPHMHGEVFVRTNNITDNIGILFELCISYKRTSTQERGEFSCGWVHLPLLENGTVIMNKSFDLYVHGGTFYEKGVEVDPSISRRTTSNALVSLISGNKQPRLLLKVHVPRQIHKDLMDTLPDTLVGNTCLLRLYSYFRQCQADRLLRDRLDLNSTELIHDPLLKEFPSAADTPDLMEFFTHEWIRKLREVKRDEKLLAPNPLKDEEYMKELFQKVFMESVYPVSHLAMLPEYKMGSIENAQLRHESVTKFAELKRLGKTPLSALLSADLMYEPFTIDEVAFNIIGPHCLSKQAVASES